MIVDCHTHVDFGADNAGPSDHLAAAQMVDACIILAEAEMPSERANKRVADYVKKHKERMIGFAFIEPTVDKTDPTYIKQLKEKYGFEGIVLYCSTCGFHPAHSGAMRLYESAERLGMPVFFHNGGHTMAAEAVLEYAQPYLLDEVSRRFPGLKIIIGNMGIPFAEQTFSMVAKHKHVYADLTMRPSSVWQLYNTVVAAHERGVMDKLLFGSGFPMGNAQQCMETLLGFNMLLADTNLPSVPRNSIRGIIERETLQLLGIAGDRAGGQGAVAKEEPDREKQVTPPKQDQQDKPDAE